MSDELTVEVRGAWNIFRRSGRSVTYWKSSLHDGMYACSPGNPFNDVEVWRATSVENFDGLLSAQARALELLEEC